MALLISTVLKISKNRKLDNMKVQADFLPINNKLNFFNLKYHMANLIKSHTNYIDSRATESGFLLTTVAVNKAA